MNASEPTQQSVLLRASLRILLVLTFFGVLLTTNQPTASAQQCAPGCPQVRIVNCTWPPIVYNVQFFMCCNGMQVFGPFINVPPAPAPGQCSVFFWAPPMPCTVIGVANIVPPPPAGWFYNPATCTLDIF